MFFGLRVPDVKRRSKLMSWIITEQCPTVTSAQAEILMLRTYQIIHESRVLLVADATA